MEKILQAFKFADLQTFCNIILKLKEHDKNIKDVFDYVSRRGKMGEFIPVWRRCPECRSRMILFPVNTNKGNQVGEGLKCQWYCGNCDHEIYSKKTVREEMSRR